MRAFKTLQNSISAQACSMPHFYKCVSGKAKLSLAILAAGILASSSALANCNNSPVNPGSIIGSLTGAAVGTQVKGNQRTTAIAVGAAVGGIVGNNLYKEDCSPNRSDDYVRSRVNRVDPNYEASNRQIRAQYEATQRRQAMLREERLREQSSRINQQEIICDPVEKTSSLNVRSVFGAVAGAAVGHALVKGNQQTTATAVGAAVGALTGDAMNDRANRSAANCVTVNRAPVGNEQVYGVNERNLHTDNQWAQLSPLSSSEIMSLNASVDDTMLNKQVWETSLQAVANAARQSNPKNKKDRDAMGALSKLEESNRAKYVESRDELYLVFETVSSVGQRDISRYAPIIHALNQIPTEGVISVSGLLAKENVLRASPEYNRAFLNAKRSAPIVQNSLPINGSSKVAF